MNKRNTPLLIGSKFNKLTIVEILENYYDNTTYKRKLGYKCVCDCGKEVILRHKNLVRPTTRYATKSCGCAHKKSGDEYSPAFNEVYKYYRLNAQKRKYGFELTKEQFTPLIFGNCHFCKDPPGNKKQDKRKTTRMTYSGIDRKDNTKGYTVENSVSCCAPCNRMKMAFTVEFFKEQIVKIYENMENF